MQSRSPNPLGFVILPYLWLLVFCFPSPNSALAGGVVSSPTEAALVAAVRGGGTVTFGFDGIVTLTNTIYITNNIQTILDGTGRTVTISGSGVSNGLFIINNTTVIFRNLVLANGVAIGSINLTNFQLISGCGGAVSNGGFMEVINCIFSNNSALGFEWGGLNTGEGLGGAIFNAGSLIVSNSLFLGNEALGANGEFIFPTGPSTSGSSGYGGAIANTGSALVVACVLSNNQAAGGTGGADVPSVVLQ